MTKDLSLIWLLYKHFGTCICLHTSHSIFEEVPSHPLPPLLLSSDVETLRSKYNVQDGSENMKLKS